jgi:hypothetical protein
MQYRAQYLVPIVMEFEAESDDDAKAKAEEFTVGQIIKYGDAGYPDLGYHALIDENGRTIDET